MAVTLHTSLGDLKLELFCELAPKTAKVSPHTQAPTPSAPTSPLSLPCPTDCHPPSPPFPMRYQNFLALSASGVYDGTVFHRNIKGFIIQGGDPTGTGKGGAAFHGGRLEDEVVDSLQHSGRGVVSMANKGPNTAGSQFFICYSAAPHLNGVNSVFAKVIDGFEVLEAMERSAVDSRHRPLAPITLHRVTVHANPIADEEHRRG